MIRLASAILLVIAAGILQNTDLLNIAGVKPNLSLAALIVLGFFINKFTDYLILILISALLIKTAAGFEISIIVFAAIPAIFYFLRRLLPWRASLNNLILIFAGTLLLYLLIDPAFISRGVGIFISEAAYNLILGAVLFWAGTYKKIW
ncbi:MAG: hypothetical protein A3A16_02180 [Candidatus Harrisonbacteria bacterium RIFCSPLOWO2_01_FULL_44_18]|uniref:Rod shape-determining protein MreD n=1 Tax=Candidatus Harrisonbacteria bacterium RIFCSPLOWO2_01_FULL_44_18 TaxID=1798407 RepID=A0A1G1ZMR9_9BACT|nr:MAG: hypothetical protein A3A16_02180 [Candidatus Harrisonbacteria bacterium RIFCSPLOWO2_01_FULL_44_18]